jgi:hypothetical protein
MWALKNRTPYAVARNWIRDKKGAHYWLVVVKATFALRPDGKLKLADEQIPPVLTPVHHGEPGVSSLRYDSDLLEIKPRTDLVVNAFAHAPGEKAVTKVEVTLQVDRRIKHLRVHGPRFYSWSMGFLKCTSPQPFVSQPIVYEWAYGGSDLNDPEPKNHRIDARNPVGKSFSTREAHLKDKPAHSIEYAAGDAAKAGPAGFGPIDRSWSPRREFAGTYDDKWENTKKPLLPDDYDERFALCSPVDQLTDELLRGGETIKLTNMTKEGALSFELPKHYFSFTTVFGPRRELHRGTLATVVIEPDESRLMMVWQSALLVRSLDTEQLDETVVIEKPFLL